MATPKTNDSQAAQYCRCCCNATDLLFDVFVTLEEFKCSICDLIAGCCGIIISEQDDSSKNICGDCLRDLSNTFRFRERCFRTNPILQETSHGSGGPVTKDDPESEKKASVVGCDAKENSSKGEKEAPTKELVKARNKKERTFTCFACRNTFVNRQNLTDHVHIHRYPYQCNVCFERFKQSRDLVFHRGTHHTHEL